MSHALPRRPRGAAFLRVAVVSFGVVALGVLGMAGCQTASEDDPRAGFTGDAAPAGGSGGSGGGTTGGGAPGGGSGGGSGGAVPPGDACRFTFVYRGPRAADAPTVETVRAAGAFEPNPWAGEVRLDDADADGTFTADVFLVPGRYEYKFVVAFEGGGAEQWVLDDENPTRTDDGRGNVNSVLEHTCPFLPECLIAGDCGEGSRAQVCRYYACVDASECVCDPGLHCDTDGACVPDPQCYAERPCAAPSVCRDGVCGPECTADADCAEGQRCRDLACFTPECATDAECADPLEESCLAEVCAENPCEVHLFTLALADAGPEQPRTVHVAGTFNEWAPTIAEGGWEMELDAVSGVFFTKRTLENGDHLYKFVINEGELWIPDPGNPEQIDDTFGSFNSVILQDCQGQGPGACGDVSGFDWRDAVMYFVLVDRFFDSDGMADPVDGASGGDARTGPSGQYEGGDLAGVTAKMPYLRDLGVTALWLSAPYENRNGAGAAIDPQADQHQYSGYHGYWPSPGNIDYSDPENPTPEPQVESRIGTSADLHGVVDAAHAGGVKVLFDYVMGHVDADSGLARAHDDWFARDNGRIRLCGPENLWDDPVWGVLCAFTDYLPKFDFRREDVRAWSVSDALYWARTYGIDGYRLDAIKHQPLEWLQDLRARLNAEIEAPAGGRFYLVGETFAYDDQALLRRFVDPATLLDGQFDFPFKARLCEALFTGGGRLDTFAGWLSGNDAFYGPGSLMTTWIGNHDIPRAIHFASGEIGSCREGSHPGNGWTQNYRQPQDAAPYERLGLAFTVMFTNPGIPLVYYGDEVGLAGGGDPDNRRMMPWNDADLLPPQRALRDLVARLGHIRAENKVLSRGRRIPISADQDTWVYRMAGCGSDAPDVTVALNRSGSARTVALPASDTGYVDLLRPDAPPLLGETVELAPRSAVILRAAAL